MRRFRLFILLLIAIGVAWNILYFQDPWLWRRFTSMFTYMVGGQSQVLSPSEPVASDGTYILDVADPEEQTIEPLALTALNNYAASFDSYALVVLHKGKIQTEWYAPGFNQESLTQSQSMHKTVVAILIGKAIEEGLIESIDDPVGRYVKEWENDPRGNITLYELLIMSSGLAQYDFTLNPFADDFRWLYSGDTQQYVLKTPLADWQPGSRFDYNNINAE
ncbi:MAG: serine hydrolase, partial [Gammaproteobacteria bacterium]|nr:serine hydrolase [Gammaproteobacteria bacterium]